MALGTVTNARASGDYHAGSDQWRPLGTTGIFGWAVAIAPTKDNYWSTDKQVIPTPLHVLGRISPIFSPFFPVFSRFLRVFTVSTRRFQRAPSRNTDA